MRGVAQAGAAGHLASQAMAQHCITRGHRYNRPGQEASDEGVPMSQRMNANARRLQLLDTAARCFAEYGYRGTTTAMLAKEAGITVPILYRHFADKHDLFIALIESVGHQVVESWREATRGIPSPLGQLREILVRNPATAEPTVQRVYRLMFHASTEFTEPEIQVAIREHYKTCLRFLSKTVRSAQQAGEVRNDVDADTLAWHAMYLAIGFAMARWVDVPGSKGPGSSERTIELILDLLAPRLTSSTR